MKTSYIKEIFYSLQGEGLFAGQPQYFLRFCGCNLDCPYCDTDNSIAAECRLEIEPGGLPADCPSAECFSIRVDASRRAGGRDILLPNPLSSAEILKSLLRIKADKKTRAISLTGGEPLLQKDLLLELLPALKAEGYTIHLETNGSLVEELRAVQKFVDVIAMDIKLFLLNDEAFLLKQKKFLELARQRQVFIKMVSTPGQMENIEKAVQLIQGTAPGTPVFFQPASGQALLPQELLAYQDLALKSLPEVRIVPQLHKVLGIK